ncbi:hypothetical protein BX666DRAFT_1875459 [Dichotomocladium elegans]|nr:hypothetical protein BX666DRAFT_1875459 [Dichotomocladium elegans]
MRALTSLVLLLEAVAVMLPDPLYASSFAYEDFISSARYRVVLTENQVPESHILEKQDIQGTALSAQRQQVFLDHLNDRNDKSVLMMNSYGQPYHCTIPDTNEDKTQPEADTSRDTLTGQEMQQSIERGLKLLEPLGKQGCLYFPTPGYWTYEYCHMRHVRQFHMDPKDQRQGGSVNTYSLNPTFYLGYFNGAPPAAASGAERPENENTRQQTDLTHTRKKEPAAPTTSLHSVGDQRFLTQRWSGGTTCDLTGKPRSIEIQFHCDLQANDRISMFQEVATCQYQMIITTPRLCEEMMLTSQSQSDINNIICNPIVPDHLISARPSAEVEEDMPPQADEPADGVSPAPHEQKLPGELSKDALVAMVAELQAQLAGLQRQWSPEEAGMEDYMDDQEGLPAFRVSEETVLVNEHDADIQKLVAAYVKLLAPPKDDSSTPAREENGQEDEQEERKKTSH